MTRRTQSTATAPTCRCPKGPLVIGTFRDQALVRVEFLHWSKDGCWLGVEDVDPAEYMRGGAR